MAASFTFRNWHVWWKITDVDLVKIFQGHKMYFMTARPIGKYQSFLEASMVKNEYGHIPLVTPIDVK